MMRRFMALGLMSALSLGAAAQAHAQGHPVRFEVTPAAGATLFASDLPTEFQLTGDFGDLIVLEGVEIDPALAVGGRLGIRVGDAVGIGASLLYSPLNYTESGTEQDGGLFMYGADVSWHAVGVWERVTPFVVGGVGAKTYDFEGAELEHDLMWNVGAGFDVGLTQSLALRLEARDYMSIFDPSLHGVEDELQHDIALTAGLRFSFDGPQRHASAQGGRRGR